MVHSNKKFLLCFLVLISAIITIMTYFMYYKQDNKINTLHTNLVNHFDNTTLANNNVFTHYLAKFDKQENDIWSKIKGITDISKDEFMAMKNEPEWRSSYNQNIQNMIEKKQSEKLISQKNIELINQILNSCGIDPEKINIVSSNSFSPVAATDTALFINEEKFNALSLKIQKFVLTHESSHIVHQDHSTRCILGDLNYEENNTQLEGLITQLTYFSEIKADIFAILKGQEITEGQIEFMKLCLKLYGNKPGRSHPSNGERLEIGHKLLAMIQNNDSNQA